MLSWSHTFSKKKSILETSKKVQNEFNESREHELVSQEQIKKKLNLSQKDELFQTLYIFENYPKQEEIFLKSDKKELLQETNNWRREVSWTDINFYVEFDEEVTVEIRYLKDVFTKKYIREILKLYKKILKDITTNSL